MSAVPGRTKQARAASAGSEAAKSWAGGLQ